VALLDRWLAHPHETRRRSQWLFLAIALGLAAAMVAAILIALWLLYLLLSIGR
jgi:hypothetical protein